MYITFVGMEQLIAKGAFPIDKHKDVELFVLPANEERDFHLLYTDGLRRHRMSVPEDNASPDRCELYFCLPSYWKWDEEHMEKENFNFPIHWIKRIMNVPIERDTFIAVGHTFPAGNPPKPICELTRQNAFVLGAPIKAKEVLKGIEDKQGTIPFLSIIPLYKQELDYKHLQGSRKFYERFNKLGYDEEVNVSRTPFKLKRFLFF